MTRKLRITVSSKMKGTVAFAESDNIQKVHFVNFSFLLNIRIFKMLVLFVVLAKHVVICHDFHQIYIRIIITKIPTG